MVPLARWTPCALRNDAITSRHSRTLHTSFITTLPKKVAQLRVSNHVESREEIQERCRHGWKMRLRLETMAFQIRHSAQTEGCKHSYNMEQSHCLESTLELQYSGLLELKTSRCWKLVGKPWRASSELVVAELS
jgi:hypothetical protein